MLHLVLTIGVAAYGATATVVTQRFWTSVTRRDVERAVMEASLHVPPWGHGLVRHLGAPARVLQPSTA